MSEPGAPIDSTLIILRTIRLQLATRLEWRSEVSRDCHKLNTRMDRMDDRLDRIDGEFRDIKGDMHSLQNAMLNFPNRILFELAARDEISP